MRVTGKISASPCRSAIGLFGSRLPAYSLTGWDNEIALGSSSFPRDFNCMQIQATVEPASDTICVCAIWLGVAEARRDARDQGGDPMREALPGLNGNSLSGRMHQGLESSVPTYECGVDVEDRDECPDPVFALN
jgi:hypothetical protein